MNVWEAGLARMRYVFDEFEKIYISFSGGKDSGLLVQLANMVAREKRKRFDLLILDIEGNYSETVRFIHKIEKMDRIDTVYHFCLPFYEDNHTSFFQPQWKMWDPNEKENWIQPLPKNAITLENMPASLVPFYKRSNGNPDRFLRFFADWYSQKHNCMVACGVGIRTQESLHRYNAIMNGVNKYKNRLWINQTLSGNVNFYPLYDWKVEDVWAAVFQNQMEYNHIYEKMYLVGMKLNEMRICQPYGLTQRKGLSQYARLEPDTWERVVRRVSGANFGNLYGKTSLLGRHTSEKPDYMTWQEYAVFLLETLGLYAPKLRDHYYRKIKILLNYYQKKFVMDIKDMPDASTRKEWLKDEKLWNDWKGIAKTLEKNDFALTSRNYSLTKVDEKELYEMFHDYQDFLGIGELKGKKYGELQKKWEEEAG